MKRMCLVLMVILCCSVVFAGPRDELWRDVEKAMDGGLPATAISTLDQIIPGALADQAHAEAIKAICLKIKLAGDIQGGGRETMIVALQTELAQAPEAMNPVMEALLAHWFWQYYQQNQWRFIQRTETAEAPGDDITTWDLVRILAEIDQHFLAALADDQTLKAIAIAQYDDLIETGNVPDAVRPTLYDFLVHEALSFYQAGVQGAYRPQDYFEIMADSPVFGTMAEFLAWDPQTTQLDSPKLRAIGLYQDLLSFHQPDVDPSALMDADLHRLKFAYNTAIGPDKDAVYMAALERFVGQWGGYDASAEALYLWASVLRSQGENLQAHALATQGRTQYFISYGGGLCYDLIRQIEGKSVTIKTERVWNAPWPDIQVTYRNVARAYFRAVPVDFKLHHTTYAHLNSTEKQQILAMTPAAQWQADLPETLDFNTRTEPVLVPQDLAKGFYYVIASFNPSFSEAWNQLSLVPVWVSDLALVIRAASREGKIEGFVLDARTGDPVEGAIISQWDSKEIRETATDGDGLFDLAYNGDTSRFLLKAQYDDDVLFSESTYRIHASPADSPPTGRTVFFTDRALYRPGQTVQYKGICLFEDKVLSTYQAFANQNVIVAFRDTSNQEIARQTHVTNEYGSFSGSFIAPSDRLLGRMSLLVAGGPHGYTAVQVEEYKRPTFQVTLDVPAESPRLNDAIMVPGQATAYTGSQVGGAQVVWHVTRLLRFPRWCWWVPLPQTQVIAQGTSVTRVDGTFDIPFTAKPDLSVLEAHEPVFLYRVHADVTDTAGETRSSDSVIQIGYTALQAAFEADTWQTPESPVLLNMTTESHDGKPESAACTVSVYTLKQPDTVKRGPLSYTYSYRSYSVRPASDDTNPETWDLYVPVFEGQVTTDVLGQATLSVPLNAGIYRAVMDTQDRFGKPVTANKTITVVDPGAAHFDVSVPNHVCAESWSVEPGDRFFGLWGTGYDTGRAFVEIECKGQVLSAEWTDADLTQKVIEQPITEDMRGGVTLRVTYVRENRAYVTERIVAVPWTNKTLTVVWERFRSKLLPGQAEQWTAKITGPGAKKAVAEMVAGLYDASLDQLLGHKWIEKFGGFRQETSRLTSRFANSAKQFNVMFSKWHVSTRFVPRIYRHFPEEFGAWFYWWGPARSGGSSGGGGRGGDDGVEVVDTDKADGGSQGVAPAQDPLPPAVNLDQVVARTEFNETAFFYPHLMSNDDGEVQIEFTLPEDLTEWRFMGFAHDKAMRSGFLSDTMVTAKDLMVQANAPRFVREGDVIEFPVKVTNQSAARQTGQVRLTFSNLRTEASMDSALGNLTTEQAFDVPSQESRTYTWRITVPDGCETLVYKAVGATTRLSDGEEAYLPVLSRRQLVIESLPLPIRGAQTKEFEFGSLLASGQSDTLQHQSLTVQMVSQPAWYAVMALPYLMEYPHRSTDHIFNRYYANSLAAYIANSDPRIRTVFDQWKNTEALDSPLDKNEDLKAVLLEETPWVRQAESESQARRNVGILFDQNRLTQELSSTLAQLKARQYASGLWPWYPGGRGNEYITLRIVCGFGRLRHLGIDLDVSRAIKGLDALDGWVHDYLTRDEDHRVHRRPNLVLYLYARSFFLEDAPIDAELWAALQPELDHLRAHWLTLPRQSKAQLALALKRLGDLDTPHAIMASILEYAVQDEELGMFWRDLEYSWSWFHAPIETQAMMIEALDEVVGDADAVQACQVWLLKQKQTQHWKTTRATVDSIYALLLRGNSLLASNEIVDVALAGQWIVPEKIEAGTGLYETRFTGPEIEPAMGRVTVRKQDEGVSWGAVHWQYLEDVGKISAHTDTPLQLVKTLYTKENTESGPVLFPVQGALAVGDELVVRLELRVDRDMEYVHLKDQRGSGTEPVAALSRYRHQDGLGYYESVRDTATHFFMAYLPKGTYVFEYSTRVQLKGQYQSGIASIQCLYAPEFNSHSQSFELEVE